MKGKFIVVTGPSASGKTSLVNALLKELPNSARLMSVTTRAPRDNEKHGKDYSFITSKEFEEKIKRDEFFEYAEVYGNMYGSSKKVLESFLGNYNYVFAVIDVQGAETFKKQIPGCFVIFVRPGSIEDIIMRFRTERKEVPAEEAARRIQTFRDELALAETFDAVVNNIHGKFEQSIEDVHRILSMIE